METQKGDDDGHDIINKINDPASLSILLPLISIFSKKLLTLGLSQHLDPQLKVFGIPS